MPLPIKINSKIAISIQNPGKTFSLKCSTKSNSTYVFVIDMRSVDNTYK